MSEKKKAEKVFKTFRTIVKKVGEGADEGVIDLLIPMSTGSTDRRGESIDPNGWKKHLKDFKKRAIMTSSHMYYGLQNQIGEFLDLQVTEEGLFARPKYYINQGNPEADWGYFIATQGKAAFSVGFIPIKWEDSDGKGNKPTRTFTEQELIEIAHVVVPSNRDTIMGLQAKGIDDPVILKIVDEIIEDKEFFKEEETKEVKDIIKDKVKNVTPDPIDPDKVKVSIEKDEKLEKMIEELKFYPEIKYFVVDKETEEEEEDIKISQVQTETDLALLAKIYRVKKWNKELSERLKDLELKAGAVLNAKNKSNLKNAQALVQTVLDSAGAEEGQEGEENETKDTKKDDTVITITKVEKEDPGKDKKTDEKTITINEKVIAEAVSKAMKYQLGIIEK